MGARSTGIKTVLGAKHEATKQKCSIIGYNYVADVWEVFSWGTEESYADWPLERWPTVYFPASWSVKRVENILNSDRKRLFMK